MVAKHDKTRSTFFVMGPHTINACLALSDGIPGKGSFSTGFLQSRIWTICEHLASPENALEYHKEMNPILIVHGFVLCHECNNRNILTGQEGFNKMLRESVPQDDAFFQKFIIKKDVLDENCYWAKLTSGTNENTENRKRICPHLNTPQKLNAHYASKQMLYWHRGNLMCDACRDDVKNGKADAIEKSSLELQEKMFTEQFITPLCLINRKYFGPQR